MYVEGKVKIAHTWQIKRSLKLRDDNLQSKTRRRKLQSEFKGALIDSYSFNFRRFLGNYPCCDSISVKIVKKLEATTGGVP